MPFAKAKVDGSNAAGQAWSPEVMMNKVSELRRKDMQRIIRLGVLLGVMIPAWVWGQNSSNLEVGFAGGMINFETDQVFSQNGLSYDLFLRKWYNNHFYSALSAGFAKQTFGHEPMQFTTNFLRANLCAGYELFPFSPVSPFLQAGGGAINFAVAEGPAYWDGEALVGGGLSLKLGKSLRFGVAGALHFTTGDDYEGLKNGTPDRYASGQAGLSWAFSRPPANGDAGELSGMSATEHAASAVETAAGSAEISLADRSLEENIRDRIAELEKQMQAYQEMKALLRKQISMRDEEIRKLETQLANRTK
jgi:hypothetical protein